MIFYCHHNYPGEIQYRLTEPTYGTFVWNHIKPELRSANIN